jgi:S-adenosylmethionine synthetase
MIEKVNPQHPDKVADRVAGALVDYAYSQNKKPKIAVEVLIGHGKVFIIAETSVQIPSKVITDIIGRIAGVTEYEYIEVPQDPELATNQEKRTRAGDNGIFRGVPVNTEVKKLSDISKDIFSKYPTDGKYILSGKRLIVCQSNAKHEDLLNLLVGYELVINPLGYWTGGLDVDTGAVNRKLGSDMGEAVTGGGLHGKDLSKADVSVNIYAHLKAQNTGEVIELSCAIGDDTIDGKKYDEIVEIAKNYIIELGGFEKLAEWGLV